MSITISQIKAGRGLLGWAQDVLAERAGISKPALANIERGTSVPREGTVRAIVFAMEVAGLEFTDGPGVRMVQDRLDVQVFRGHDAIDQLWEDVYQTLGVGEERLISCVDENRFLESTQDRFAAMMGRYEEKGISGRILALQGDRNFVDPTSEYRWVSPERFEDISYYVYGDKFATLLWEPTPRVILIHNAAMAENYRAQFNRHWALATVPSCK